MKSVNIKQYVHEQSTVDWCPVRPSMNRNVSSLYFAKMSSQYPHSSSSISLVFEQSPHRHPASPCALPWPKLVRFWGICGGHILVVPLKWVCECECTQSVAMASNKYWILSFSLAGTLSLALSIIDDYGIKVEQVSEEITYAERAQNELRAFVTVMANVLLGGSRGRAGKMREGVSCL